MNKQKAVVEDCCEVSGVFPWLVRIAVACAELWNAQAWLFGLASPGTLVAMHVAIVAVFVGAFWLIDRKAAGGLLIDAAMLLLTGPLAAVGMLLRRQKCAAVVAISAAPTAPVSLAEALYSDVVAGRRPRRDPSNRLSILDRLSGGDLATQQFAVAAISRTYRPEMHPALMAALQSQIPAIRVQAAAVFAKLREQYASQAKRLLRTSVSTADDGETLPQQKRTAAACRNLARSPFLDEVVIQALMDKAHRLEEELAAAVSAPATAYAATEPVMDSCAGIEMTLASENRGIAIEADTSAARRIARFLGSPFERLERVA